MSAHLGSLLPLSELLVLLLDDVALDGGAVVALGRLPLEVHRHVVVVVDHRLSRSIRRV